jgi:hypothetical protein
LQPQRGAFAERLHRAVSGNLGKVVALAGHENDYSAVYPRQHNR